MKDFLQQLARAFIAVLPVGFVYVALERLALPRLRSGSRYAPALVYAAASQYRQALAKRHSRDHVIAVEVPLGYRMCIPISDNNVALRRFGVYHARDVLHAVERLCPAGSTVCELGTHLGEMTLYLGKLVSPRGRVHAFEIDSAFCRILEQSLELNGFTHVHLENKAVGAPGTIDAGDGYGDIPTMMKNFPELNASSYLGTDFFTGTPDTWNRAEMPKGEHRVVERIDLCDYFTRRNVKVDTFFMDIEGSEIFAIPMILKLGQQQGYRPRIMFEIHHNTYSSEQVHELRKLLLEAGYRMSSPDDRHVVCESQR